MHIEGAYVCARCALCGYHKEGKRGTRQVGHASRSRLHLEYFESKTAIKAKAKAFRSTYLDIALSHIRRLEKLAKTKLPDE